MHADATFPRSPLDDKFWFENTKLKVWGNLCTLFQNTNKEASTVFCSVLKHLGSSRALEAGKNTQLRLETKNTFKHSVARKPVSLKSFSVLSTLSCLVSQSKKRH